jgi:hypothetical protein
LKTKDTKMGKGALDDKKSGGGSREVALEPGKRGRGGWIMENGSTEEILCQ